MSEIVHLNMSQLEAELAHIQQSPKDEGMLQLIVRRPTVDERESLQEGELDVAVGLVGDNWQTRGSSSRSNGSANPEMQLTVMNSRVAALVAQEKARWELAGDQLYLDMDLSHENLPAGTQLAIGTAIIEITATPHTGCKKFVGRFGLPAMKFVNSAKVGKPLRLRGLNAKVIKSGMIKVGDIAKKL